MTSPLRVLYAEDNAHDADLTRVCFADQAPEVHLEVVPTGAACMASLAEGGWDLLLLDHHLPDMDGLDLLRSLFHQGETVPVILVTGAGDEDLVVKALRLGAVNYVPKTPDHVASLPDLVIAAVEEHRLKRSQGWVTNVRRRILYVEHQAMDIDLTLRHFAESAPSLDLDIVPTCTDALSRLSRTPAYDAALIDLRMPDMTGLDFVREAGRLRLPLPPFIMISGQGDDAAAIASLRLGAADYVVKREGYLHQLVYTIERAIAYDQLERANRRLLAELAERLRAEAQRDRLEEQLRVSQKMEALGSLAGGIAHDFNNLLSVIFSYTESVMDRVKGDARATGELLEVMKAGERAVGLTRQLLAFSRNQVLQPVPLDLNEVVLGIEQMLRRILDAQTRYAHVLAPDLGVVRADRGQIEQVLMNLVVNARDAMPNGGSLTIETSNVGVDDEGAAQDVALKPGRYVRLAVTDTGCGMDARTQARIFEPLFTTKEPGKGTGLGLSTVYGIVQQSGGSVRVNSEPGRGATFEILLPS